MGRNNFSGTIMAMATRKIRRAVLAALISQWMAQMAAGAVPPSVRVLVNAQDPSTLRCSPKSNTKLHLNAEKIALLTAKARREGTVRVIVGLCVDFAPEGTYARERDVQKQRRMIARAQDGLIKKMSRHKLTAVKKYSFVPFMVMAVDTAALLFLNSSPLVATIEEDAAVPSAPTN